MTKPDWQLPAGVPRSLWEFAHDPAIARDEARHLADAPLLEFDQHLLSRWLTSPGTLIDLGCGTGRHLVEMAGRGWQVVGVDLSLESLNVARERAAALGREVMLVHGNLCELEFLPAEQFDAALLLFGTLGMISGAEHRMETLQHVSRLLRPGGRLVLHVHNVWRHAASPQGRKWLIRDLWKRLRRDPTAGDTFHDYRGIPRMFHHSFTFRELRGALEAAGMSVREAVPLATVAAKDGAASSDAPALALSGPLRILRATGWIVLAERDGDVSPAR
jgi:SAM-dependent methyltransferase